MPLTSNLMLGTYLGSAIFAQIILKMLGQI